MYDLYSMEYVLESPNNGSNSVLQCVQNLTNIPGGEKVVCLEHYVGKTQHVFS